jgi:hypothetical protein
MVLEKNAHARAHNTFWLKSHLYPMMLKSSACADCPWITFAKPKDLNENGLPLGSLAKTSLQPWMRLPATILLVLLKAKRKSSPSAAGRPKSQEDRIGQRRLQLFFI